MLDGPLQSTPTGAADGSVLRLPANLARIVFGCSQGLGSRGRSSELPLWYERDADCCKTVLTFIIANQWVVSVAAISTPHPHSEGPPGVQDKD